MLHGSGYLRGWQNSRKYIDEERWIKAGFITKSTPSYHAVGSIQDISMTSFICDTRRSDKPSKKRHSIYFYSKSRSPLNGTQSPQHYIFENSSVMYNELHLSRGIL